jgi:uncharacterized membrane protein
LTARIRKLLSDLRETFWLVPGLMVLAGALSALVLLQIDHSGVFPSSMDKTFWVYRGDATGARTLLGAIASSTIAVAATVFSITIAALTLAAGQMGPRLLHNFTRDRGNQFTLGVFLTTFAFALIVLRSVRAEFTPHVSLTVAILLALVCVGTLVWFVGHLARRLNVDTVIDLVSADLAQVVHRLSTDDALSAPPPESYWRGAVPVHDHRCGYLHQLDENGLADWAAAHDTAVWLLVKPGDYVFPGAPIALVKPPAEGAAKAIHAATALGQNRSSRADVEFAARQIVEVAVRALSPSMNDPNTACSALDHLGSALCRMVSLQLPTGVYERDGRVVLMVPRVGYAKIVSTMFHKIRQNAAGNAAVLHHILEVLTAVASCEREPTRVATLQEHADLVLADAARTGLGPAEVEYLRGRHADFEAMCESMCGSGLRTPPRAQRRSAAAQ